MIRHSASWRMALEALGVSEVTTARRIDAGFPQPQLGKVWKYGRGLRGLAGAVEHYGRPMTVAEFDLSRERRFQLARPRTTAACTCRPRPRTASTGDAGKEPSRASATTPSAAVPGHRPEVPA